MASGLGDVGAETPKARLKASLSPQSFKRGHFSPSSLRLGFEVPRDGSAYPALKSIRFWVSPQVRFRFNGLPGCRLQALFDDYGGPNCAGSLIGTGHAISEIALEGEAPVTVNGRLKAYLSHDYGRLWIFARVVTGEPLPLIYVVPFEVEPDDESGATRLVIKHMRLIHGICALPKCGRDYTLNGIYSHISDFEINLHRRYQRHGRRFDFVTAECPARPGQTSTAFALAGLNLIYDALSHTDSDQFRCRVA